MKRITALLIGIIISIVFLYLTLYKINLGKVISHLKGVNLLYLVFFLIASLVGTFVRSFRWRVIISTVKLANWKNIIKGIVIAIGSNYVLPFRMGDIAQSYFLATKEDLSKSFTFGTVMLEHYFDVIVALLFLMFSSIRFILPINIIHLFIVFFLLIFVLFFFANKLRLFLQRVNPKSFIMSKLLYLFSRFLDGLTLLKTPQMIMTVASLSLLIWLIYALKVYIILQAFGVQLHFFAAIFVVSVTAFAIMVPSSPGYIGTFEFFTVYALFLLKVARHIGLGVTLISRFIETFTYTPLALAFLFSEKYLIKEFKGSISAFKEDKG